MSRRAGHLFYTQAMSFGHKLRHDLASEIVVALSSVILAATFFYVFRDFLQEQVQDISYAMFHRFATVGSHLVLAIMSLTIGRTLRRSFDPTTPSLWQTAKVLGEDKPTLRTFRLAWQATLTIVLVGCFAWGGALVFSEERFYTVAKTYGWIYLLAGLALSFYRAPSRKHTDTQDDAPVKVSLFHWRLRWWMRSRLAHLGLLCGCVMLGLATLAAWRGLPDFVAAVCAYAGGLFWAIPLTFQLADDLQVAWVERSLGVSHQEFFKTYDQLGMGLGAIIAIITAILLGATGLEPMSLLKAAGAAATPALVEPATMFQIDARRPVITIMILILVSLFIATAIIAHPISLLLLLVLKYYARTSQEGRFYRA